MKFSHKNNGNTITLNKEVNSTKMDFYGGIRDVKIEGITVSKHKRGVVINVREAENKPSKPILNGIPSDSPYTWKLNRIILDKEEVYELINFLNGLYMEDDE